MRLPNWLGNWWGDIKGNAKWAITLSVAGLIVAGGTWALASLTKLLHGLSAAQQTTVLMILVIAWIVAIACFVWAVMARRGADARVRAMIDTVKVAVEMLLEDRKPEPAPPALESARLEPVILTPPPAPSGLAQVIRGAPGFDDILKNIMREQAARPPLPHKEQANVKLNVDIQEVFFRQTGGSFLGGLPKDLVLMRLNVTNTGRDEPTARTWKLTVQIGRDYRRETEETKALAGGLVIRRKGEFNTTTDESVTPDIVALSRTQGFEFGKQRVGWIMFELYSDYDAVPPYHAMLSVSITDSLGNVHVGTLEPARYIPKGEIHTV
jgi:hypothetical protein